MRTHLPTPALAALLLAALTAPARAQVAAPPLTPPAPSAPAPLVPAPPTPNAATSGRADRYRPGAPLGDNGLPSAPPVRPLRLGLGVLLLADSKAQVANGNRQFTATVGLDLMARKTVAGGVYVEGSTYDHQGSRFTLAGGGVMFRDYAFSQGPYFGLGAGAYYLDYKGGGSNGSNVEAAGRVALGYDAPEGYFLEANYLVTGEVAGRNPDNVQLLIGYRF